MIKDLDPVKLHELAGKILESLPDTLTIEQKITSLRIAASSLEQTKSAIDLSKMMAERFKTIMSGG